MGAKENEIVNETFNQIVNNEFDKDILDDEEIENVFNSVDEEILSKDEKQSIKNKLNQIKNSKELLQNMEQQEKIVYNTETKNNEIKILNTIKETILENIDSENKPIYNIEDINLENESIVQNNEGKKKEIYTTKYERDPANRKACIEKYGTDCNICGFNFYEVYGELGKHFIEVHHLKPLFSLEEEIVINPHTDLIPVCSNCHRMLHRQKN